jgi:multiple sugar transport system permease protein
MRRIQRQLLRYTGTFAKSIALGLFLLFALVPLFWILMTSIKPSKEIYTFPLNYFPSKISFAGYQKLFGFAHFGKYFLNSLGVTLLASFGGLITSILSGFALSRFKSIRKTRSIMLLLYITQMVPGFILMTPLYLMLSKLGLTDSLLGLGVVYSASTVAFGAIMAKSFFDRIPASIEEAALIDGCDPFSALIRIVLPISLPGIVAIFSFAFVNIWNELFLAVILLSSDSKMTVPVALNSFISKAGVSWDVMSAGIVVALLPTIVVFAFGQKYIVAGLTEGGVKG